MSEFFDRLLADRDAKPNDDVEEVLISRPRGKEKHSADRFIGCPIGWFDAMIEAVGGAEVAVAMLLYRERVLQGSKTVKFSSVALRERGISRYAKRRALQKLEAAGLIKVERGGNESPTVTFLDDRPARRR